MARDIPVAVASTINQPFIDEVFAFALEIYEEGADPSTYIRVINDNEDATLESNTYVAAPFSGILLTDTDGEIRSTISVRNADKAIGQGIRAAKKRIRVRMLLVDRTTDTIRWDSGEMAVLKEVEADAAYLSGEIGAAVSEQEPACFVRAIKSTCPGLFL